MRWLLTSADNGDHTSGICHDADYSAMGAVYSDRFKADAIHSQTLRAGLLYRRR